MGTVSNKSIWIARNQDGTLEAWKCQPYRHVKAFTTDNDLKDWLEYLDDDMYPEVTWENSPKELIVKP